MMRGMEQPDYPIRPVAVWHALTPLYDLGCSVLGFGLPFKRWLVGLADPRPGHRLLDVACGTGVLARHVAAARPEVATFACDADPRALAIAARPGHALRGLSVARGERLPYAGRQFDRVVCSLALHHVPDRWKAAVLAEIGRVLRPDGWLLLADFDNHRRPWVPAAFRSARPLIDWLAADFTFEQVARRRLVHVFRAVPHGTQTQCDEPSLGGGRVQ